MALPLGAPSARPRRSSAHNRRRGSHKEVVVTVSPDTAPEGATWSFNRLGPFYELQRRLGLLDDTHLAAGRRALIFATLAFVPPLLLAALQGHALNPRP